ncbi:hypothetical protein HOP50_09g54950 [Chloropicon primus]|uniref:Phytanoyl-CoA dioxygenase n=1 Tax=Chloropicon primus TaxID=1764295 RepID=A0A5B8MTI0_9CHLO|nr:hypothetical protein A3770_09p54630 [Chloropicon primus]UPR02169.1 hypothetical protein HOP50_09g54950 [Chloropicon primus]|eukprot:QDZ22945.1 hypothetical protein A3770_09p54630 [Chloropicon primus]
MAVSSGPRGRGRGRGDGNKGWSNIANARIFVVALSLVVLLTARRIVINGIRPAEAPVPVPPPPPPQRCDWTLDEQHYSSYYEDQCWKNFSVPNWRDVEGASRAIYDDGALYMKSVIDFEEAKRFSTYLASVVSPRTLDGEEYFVGNLRDPDGRYDITLDPREHAPVMDMLNKVVGRLKPTLERIVGPKGQLADFSLYVTCNSSAQAVHVDACALCCPIKDKYESRMEDVEMVYSDEMMAVLKPKYFENEKQGAFYSMFIALQPTTKEKNGVTFTYPRTHRAFAWADIPGKKGGGEVPVDYLGDFLAQNYQRCEPPLNTGDGFIYNSKTFHAANANPSISARMMLLIAFQSGPDRRGMPLGSTYSIKKDFVKPGAIFSTQIKKEPDAYARDCMRMKGLRPPAVVFGKITVDKFPLTVDSLNEIVAS